MKERIEERAIELALYIVENQATLRSAARHFGVSKSTVHKDVHERLRALRPALYKEAQATLDHNLAVRHLRGGAATAARFLARRERLKKEARP